MWLVGGMISIWIIALIFSTFFGMLYSIAGDVMGTVSKSSRSNSPFVSGGSQSAT
jgi:hypothetical protein